MAERDRTTPDRDRPAEDASEEPTTIPADEAEPDWAERIRELRRARGDRLKEMFSTFDDEEEPP